MPKTTNPRRASSSTSPFATLQRKKSSISSRPAKDDSERLEDNGLTPTLAPPDAPEDVEALIQYIRRNAFDEIPERAAGMNSVRISEVLRFRAALPPVVSVAHLLAWSTSATHTERELARLIAQGRVRKVVIPGRGRGGTAVGEGAVLTADWEERLRGEGAISEKVQSTYLALLRANPISTSASMSSLSPEEIHVLVSAGFLTMPTALASGPSLDSMNSSVSLLSLSRAGSSAATGTLAAIGGAGALHENGGSGSHLTFQFQNRRSASEKIGQTMTFSLPQTGPYLALLTQARAHLITLLKNLSPRYKEATKELLKEKWDGNVLGDLASQRKRARGEWTGVLPGKTKRWKDFYGLRFESVLAECLGSGLVEVFDTGSVGIGIRAR